MLADEVDYVIGVDTHRDQHTLAVVVAPTGAVLAQTVVCATGRGYAQALRFATSHAGGVRAWAIEGAGHYGAGLTRYLGDRGETVLEVGRHARSERRLRGKDDPLDAIRAARAGLAAETLTLPRAGQRQEALRVLLLSRRSAVDVRRVALVQLRSLASVLMRSRSSCSKDSAGLAKPTRAACRACLLAPRRSSGCRGSISVGSPTCSWLSRSLPCVLTAGRRSYVNESLRSVRADDSYFTKHSKPPRLDIRLTNG